MKVLIVVDMQVDFISGALGTSEAQAIVDPVVERVKRAMEDGEQIIFTRDTHFEDYLETQEGRKLPVKHCIRETEGWQLDERLRAFSEGCTVIDKPTFGSLELAHRLNALNRREAIEAITLIGLCTDICVISNAMIAKVTLPEVPIRVEQNCCAGVTPATHLQAIEAMKMCQIEIV